MPKDFYNYLGIQPPPRWLNYAYALIPLYILLSIIAKYLSKVINPLIMSLIYFLIITPVGLFSRLGDSMGTKSKESYWINKVSNKSKERFERMY